MGGNSTEFAHLWAMRILLTLAAVSFLAYVLNLEIDFGRDESPRFDGKTCSGLHEARLYQDDLEKRQQADDLYREYCP